MVFKKRTQIINYSEPPDSAPVNMSDAYTRQTFGHHSKNCGELWKTGHLSDFIIRCGTEEFKVHKFVLASNSKYFKGMFEAKFKEEEAGFVEFKEDESHHIKMMLDYFYMGSFTPTVIFDYEDPAFEKSDGGFKRCSNALSAFAALNILADKYIVPDLAADTTNKFSENFNEMNKLRRVEAALDALGSVLDATTYQTNKQFYRHMSGIWSNCRSSWQTQNAPGKAHFAEFLEQHSDFALAVALYPWII